MLSIVFPCFLCWKGVWWAEEQEWSSVLQCSVLVLVSKDKNMYNNDNVVLHPIWVQTGLTVCEIWVFKDTFSVFLCKSIQDAECMRQILALKGRLSFVFNIVIGDFFFLFNFCLGSTKHCFCVGEDNGTSGCYRYHL